MEISRRMFGALVASTGSLLSSSSIHAADHPVSRGALYVPRYAPSLATDGRRVLISGGAPIGAGRTETQTHSGVLSLVEAIDPDTLKQSFLANAGFPRANHASVWLGDQLWLLGGRTQLGDERRLASEVERIDLDTQAIWRGPDLPLALIDLSAVVVGHSIFVFGGIYRDTPEAASQPSNRVFECAPPYTSWTERAGMPTALGNAATVVVDEKVYVVGGFDRQKARAITQNFDPARNSWTLGTPPPRPLSAHAGTVVGRRLFMFGDYQNQGSTLGFDTVSGEWRDITLPFTPRRHVRAVQIRNQVLVVGGNQSSLAPALNNIEVFGSEMLSRAFDAAA